MSTVVGRRFEGITSKLAKYVLVGGLFSAVFYFYITMFIYLSS